MSGNKFKECNLHISFKVIDEGMIIEIRLVIFESVD